MSAAGGDRLILHAAQRYGVRATGITLSAQQRDFAVARAADLGVANSVEVRLQDYRDFGNAEPAEAFDAVASVEMGEHVGQELYPVYVGVLYRALKPGGRLLLQQMSRRSDAAPGGGAFIEAYIASDMHMRPLWQTLRYLQDADFEIRSVAAMREHYARTAEHWMDTLENRFAEFVALQGEEVARVWRLYLAGGRLAFEEGRMGVDQILAINLRDAGALRHARYKPLRFASACRVRGLSVAGRADDFGWRRSISVKPAEGLPDTTRRTSCPPEMTRRWALPAGSIWRRRTSTVPKTSTARSSAGRSSPPDPTTADTSTLPATAIPSLG